MRESIDWLHILILTEKKELRRVRALIKQFRVEEGRANTSLLNYEEALTERIERLQNDLHVLELYLSFTNLS